jgi:hypothetical protein
MRFLLVMALALLLPACASVQMATTEADVQGKRFSPPPGQAAPYVYREGMVARAVTMSVFVNQSRLGALAQENSQATSVQLAADEVRFVEIASRFGIRTARCAVVENNARESPCGRAGGASGAGAGRAYGCEGHAPRHR